MIVRKDWVATNIKKRLTDPHCDFKVTLNPYPFEPTDFHAACDEAAKEILENHKVYLSLSGGMDSIYALHCLAKVGIPFTPIIVVIAGNSSNAKETSYAFEDCEALNIKPRRVDIDEKRRLEIYWKEIAEPLSGNGVFAVPQFMVSKIAHEEGAIVVSGDNVLNEKRGKRGYASSEFEFYANTIADNLHCPFFLYSPNIVHAMVKVTRASDSDATTYKRSIYGSKPRDLVENRFDTQEIADVYKAIVTTIKHPIPKSDFSYGTQEQFLQQLTACNS